MYDNGPRVGADQTRDINPHHCAAIKINNSDLSRTHPLTAVLADLRREARVERVSLHGLDAAAVEAVLGAAARHELDESLVALAHAVQRETEGWDKYLRSHSRGDLQGPKGVGHGTHQAYIRADRP